MTAFKKARQKLTPTHLLVAGYALVTLVIAVLLALPIASSSGRPQPFVDAVFVASSGISTTGLSVVDVGKFYSLFGQIVLLIDFQIGGIGYMTLFVFTMYLLGGRLRLSYQLVAAESLVGPRLSDVVHFLKRVTQVTLIVEGIGAAILAWRWMDEFPLGQAVYLGVIVTVAFVTLSLSVPGNLMGPCSERALDDRRLDVGAHDHGGDEAERTRAHIAHAADKRGTR